MCMFLTSLNLYFQNKIQKLSDMKRLTLLTTLVALVFSLSAKEYSLESPSGKIQLKVNVDETLTY